MVRLPFCLWAAKRPNTAYTSMHIWVPLWAHTHRLVSTQETQSHTQRDPHLDAYTCTQALMLRQARGGVCTSWLFPLNEAF